MQLGERSIALAGTVASRWGLDVSIETTLEIEPVNLAEKIQAAAAAKDLGRSCLRLPAMAGHDAQVVGRVTKAGIIFVPSRGGRSHSPLEFTADEDIERGANILLFTLLKLAGA